MCPENSYREELSLYLDLWLVVYSEEFTRRSQKRQIKSTGKKKLRKRGNG